MPKKITPVRDATNAALNAAILVFIGSLVLGTFNKVLTNQLTITVDKSLNNDKMWQ